MLEFVVIQRERRVRDIFFGLRSGETLDIIKLHGRAKSVKEEAKEL